MFQIGDLVTYGIHGVCRIVDQEERTVEHRKIRYLVLTPLEQTAAGRKLHLCDDNFLRDAERLINGEFSLILGIDPGQVGGYVRDALRDA